MKVLVINCGSSSLKYQLIDMEGEKVLCKGLCERIGMESSMITHEANGHKATTPAIFPTHTEAFTEVVKKMTTGEGKVIESVSEIDAIGHRVVHGGEKFKESCLITPEVVKAIHDLSPLAPCTTPPPSWASRPPTRSLARTSRTWLFSTPRSTPPCPRRPTCTPSPTSTMRSTVSAATVSTAPATSTSATALPSSWRSLLSA